MDEVGRAYAGVRARMTALVADADPAATVPACPEWSVKDLVAHVSGVVDDALAGRLEGAGTDPWTAAQVASRRSSSLAEIVAEWNEQAPAFEELLDAIGAAGRQAVFDVTTHEHDLRGAVGARGAHDTDAVAIALGWLAPGAVAAMQAGGRPALRIRSTEGEEWVGAESPEATVEASRFELLRALSGRRSRSQILALRWEGDADGCLPGFEYGPFRIPATDVID